MASANGKTYGSLEDGQESSERAKLLVDNGTDDTTSWENGDPNKKNRFSPLVKWSLLAVVVAGGVGLAFMLYSHIRTFREPHDNGLDPSYRHGPLSQLDPVADLGLYAFDRPLATQPTVHRSLQAPNREAALPTNSWYQSFLLLPDDPESFPTNLHRVYTMPYIVDAAGPIAGLRVYPHHVGAVSNVIQTYVIEAQGLTTGLATANGNSTSTRYQVELMTPLGITMSWVSW